MTALRTFALLMALDCAAFSLQLRYHYLERLATIEAAQAAEAGAVWAHDASEGRAILDALRVR